MCPENVIYNQAATNSSNLKLDIIIGTCIMFVRSNHDHEQIV